MNSLSWLMYLSEAIPGLGVMSGLCAGALVFLIAGMIVVGAMQRDFSGLGSAGWKSACALQRMALTKLLPVVPVLVLLAILIPSKQTILMIAASEMGETVVKSPEAQEIFTDLKTILKQQLEALKK